jgi:hypothetical protein
MEAGKEERRTLSALSRSPPPLAAAARRLAVLAALTGLLALGGCATQDSEIPWNAPQPWEGSPTIPGMPRY